MSMISISLSDERLERLRALAASSGLSPEELLRAYVEQFLDQPDEQFRDAAAHVLRKNAELYRRLS